jgi:solute carrier family 13 (sodium-dependent dicarboxylate transporter), member 2/3/5
MAIYNEYKKILIAIVIAATFFALSINFFNLTQSSLIAIIALLVTLWTNEALPLAVVSLLPIILFPAFNILSTKETTINYAHPIIYLFLGGFLIAIAVEKSNLHKWIASKMLAVFPSTAKGVIFSLIITSGVLSSVLSNTTTALLLIPIALFLTQDENLQMRFALGVAYGASCGGIMTPIGTAPNLILLGFMSDRGVENISFFMWMVMVAPLSFLMFFVAGIILSIGVKNVKIEIKSSDASLSRDQKKVLGVLIFLITLLFANAPIKPYWNGLGLNESGILLGVGILMFFPQIKILDWMEDKVKIPFRIMFLFGAGFSIAKAFGDTGLADSVASMLLDLTTLNIILLLFSIAFMVTFATEITSNTALISIILPIVYSLTQYSTAIDATLIMMVATICASYAFMLPIATPPNAIAMSSGVVSVGAMAKYGFFLNIAGIIIVVTAALWFWRYLL